MRTAACLALLLSALVPGCGGGGGDEADEVVLAVWPFREDSASSTLGDRVTIGFTGDRVPTLLGDPVILGEVQDGAEGLQARVDAARGGEPFADQVARLTDGLDTGLAATVQLGSSSGSQRRLESEGLTALVPAGPDLQGLRITAFQLDLFSTSIRQEPIVPSELRGPAQPLTELGTVVEVVGEIRILGLPADPD